MSSGSLYPSEPPPDSGPGAEAPRVVRHVIAVAGGRGGVGKSIVAINLGVYLAQLGRTVVLADANPAGADLHTMLGEAMPRTGNDEDAPEEEELTPIKTQVPGLLLLPQAYSRNSTVPLRPGRKARWAFRLRQLDVDYVILDLGAGTTPATLDLFLTANHRTMRPTSPEPPSVGDVSPSPRALPAQVAAHADQRPFQGAHGRARPGSAAAAPSPIEMVRAIARYDSSVAGKLAARGACGSCARASWLIPRGYARTTTSARDVRRRPALPGSRVRLRRAHRTGRLRMALGGPPASAADRLPHQQVSAQHRAHRAAYPGARPPRADQGCDPVPIVPAEPNLYEVLWTHRASDEELRRIQATARDLSAGQPPAHVAPD
ncbi:MAG: P-loop NTPase [Polyangiaceae bacterium]